MPPPESRARRLTPLVLLLSTACVLVASPRPSVAAEDPWAFLRSAQPDTPAEPQDDPAETLELTSAPESGDALVPDPATVDWSALNNDAGELRGTPGRPTPGNGARKSDASAWSRNISPEGFSAVIVKQAVTPFWDTRVGADLNVAGQPYLLAPLPEKLATDPRLSQSSGAAWAAMTAPGLGSLWDKTAIEARVDPAQDRSKVGTTISKSLPIEGDAYSLTLQSGYNIIEQSLVPIVGINGRTARNYELDRSAKFNITGTGTSFTAGQSLSTTDDKWLRNVGAEQKLFGGISVNGSVSETLSGNLNKSLTAGFKSTW
ncbi:hypothetical protein [Bradyrhizobium prioriisuperbiae]|uniref:hypothetical protein n=1 Tax=Bradyrhizobium prioriisuperbiae TaxID=2854389 RepID=UPI0028EF8A83|nr:hypothetical protein [Bradyrhizobium prioritasuperba]